MKYLAGIFTLILAVTFSFLPQIAHANSSSTVCCNGKCTTSDSSNVNVQDNNGNCQVNFGDDAQAVSLTATPEPTEESTPSGTLTPTPTDIPTATPVSPTATPEATITPDPTIMQMRKELNTQVAKQVETLKQHLKHQDHEISAFFQSGVDVLQNFFSGLFK